MVYISDPPPKRNTQIKIEVLINYFSVSFYMEGGNTKYSASNGKK